MAYTTQTSNAVDSVSLTERLAALRLRFVEAQEKRATYRRTMRELSDLSNRELADLGLHRSGIRRVALESAYGK